MHFAGLKDSDDKRYEAAIKLYAGSFPPHEQREAKSQRNILGHDEYHFDLIYDGTIFVGLMLYWETRTFIYVEHFCVSPAVRSRGYGQKALELLRQKGKTVILEIDPPADEISKRRQAFYERAGYQANTFEHVHPPYHKGNKGHRLLVMSYPEKLTEEVYREFDTYLKGTVMDV